MGFTTRIYRSRGFRVSVSTGNTKTGHVPAFSLPPAITCMYRAPCADACYARKAYRQYGEVRRAWDMNHDAAAHAPAFTFDSIADAITREHATLFRVHVSGDFFSKRYMENWYDFARNTRSDVQFLAFTKRYEWAAQLENTRPLHFTTILSSWPGHTFENPARLPVAYMQDGTEARVPEDATHCAGNCETCRTCFYMDHGDSVVFNKH
jgi:hypothetical protein